MKTYICSIALALLCGLAALGQNSCNPGEGSHADALGGMDCRGQCNLCLQVTPDNIDIRNGTTQTFHLSYRLSTRGDAIVPNTGIVGIDWGDGGPQETFGPGTTELTHSFSKCADKCTYTLRFATTQDFQYSGNGSCSYRCSAHQVAVVRVSQPDPPPVVQPAVQTPPEQTDSRPAEQSGSQNSPSSAQLVNTVLAFVFGIVFIVALLFIAIFVKDPPPFSMFIYRVVLCLSAAGVGAVIPGIIDVNISGVVRAGGAFALFVIVYFWDPPGHKKSTKY